jgi:hypothetical protein
MSKKSRVAKSRSTSFAATQCRFGVAKSRSTSFAATQCRFGVAKSRSASFAATQCRFGVAKEFARSGRHFCGTHANASRMHGGC